jgi:hypothetical protein
MYYLRRTGTLETRLYPDTKTLLRYLKGHAARPCFSDDELVTIREGNSPPHSAIQLRLGDIRRVLKKLRSKKNHVRNLLFWLTAPKTNGSLRPSRRKTRP